VTNALTGGEYTLEARADSCVWTNISKLGEAERVASRDAGQALRRLDAEQLKAEIAALVPDWFVCLSGSERQNTGYDVWGSWPIINLESRRTPNTEIRKMPGGGVLFWSMHPNYKPADWVAGVISDLQNLRATVV
jgi:hypothetical protein